MEIGLIQSKTVETHRQHLFGEISIANAFEIHKFDRKIDSSGRENVPENRKNVAIYNSELLENVYGKTGQINMKKMLSTIHIKPHKQNNYIEYKPDITILFHQ